MRCRALGPLKFVRCRNSVLEPRSLRWWQLGPRVSETFDWLYSQCLKILNRAFSKTVCLLDHLIIMRFHLELICMAAVSGGWSQANSESSNRTVLNSLKDNQNESKSKKENELSIDWSVDDVPQIGWHSLQVLQSLQRIQSPTWKEFSVDYRWLLVWPLDQWNWSHCFKQ